jgi:hypothetical protein
VAKISAQQLAELVPCPPARVRRLVDLGLLAPSEDDGLFPSSAVHLVRLMAAFEEAGIALEDVARGVAGGDLSFPLGLFLPEPVEMPETYEALAARVGRPPELLRRLTHELGLPPPDDDRPDSGRAILTSLDLVEQTERAISVPARVGINAGPVIVQEGDYFGRTVNTAARIADYARPREVLVSEQAKRTAGIDAVEFDLISDVPLKGVSRSVRLHRGTRGAG